jgi:hypothetical protein
MLKIYLFLLSAIINLSAFAGNYEELKDISGGSGGYEYFMTFHPTATDDDSLSGFYIYAISPNDDLDVGIYIPALDYQIERNLKRNTLEKIKIPTEYALCNERGELQNPRNEQKYPGRAIYIYSYGRISLFGVAIQNGKCEMYKVEPTSNLGISYTVATWNKTENSSVNNNAYTSIITPYDNTKVRFTLGGNANTSTPLGMKPGDSLDLLMERTDIFQFSALVENSDLSGTKIISNKPIAVISGNYSVNGSDGFSTNYTIEQNMGEFSWGKEYLVTPFENDSAETKIRIFAKHKGTTIYKNGERIAELENTNGMENNEWITETVKGAAKITSDKVINVVQYNISDNAAKKSMPFQMNVMPLRNYEKNIIAVYPEDSFGNAVYYMNLVFENTEAKLPDDMKFGIPEAGDMVMKSIEESDIASIVSINKIAPDDNYYYAILKVNTENEVVVVHSKTHFAAYVYGNYAENGKQTGSFGYVAGVRYLSDYETADHYPPQVKYTMGCYGGVPLNSARPEDAIVVDWGSNPNNPPNDEEKTSGLGLIYFVENESYNYDFSHEEFVPGVDDTTYFSLRVRDINQDAYAKVIFTDRAGNDTTVIFEYKVPQIVFEEKIFVMNTEQNNLSDKIYIQNQYEKDTVKIDIFESLNENIKIDTELPFELAPGETKEISLLINENYKDTLETSLELSYSPPGKDCKILEEFAILINSVSGLPVLSAGNVDFGEIYRNREKIMELEVSNPASLGAEKPLIIEGIEEHYLIGEFASNKVFEIINAEFPVTIDVNKKYTFEIRFKPQQVKEYNATLLFKTENTLSKNKINLAGVGLMPQTLQIPKELGRFKSNPNFYKDDLINSMQYVNEIEDAIEIKNMDTIPMKITDVSAEYIERETPSFFLKIKDEYVGFNTIGAEYILDALTIMPDSTLKIPVYFAGYTTGEHTEAIRLKTNTKYNFEFFLQAIGTYPKADAPIGIKMGVPTANEPELFKSIEITNEEWEYEAPLVIYDIVSYSNNAVSDNWEDYEGYNFKFRKPVDLPIIINPGESFSIDVAFRDNGHKATYCRVRFISDAIEDEITTLSVDESVSVVEKIKGEIYIYPNPAGEYIEITLSSYSVNKGLQPLVHGEEIEIYDVLGELVLSTSVPLKRDNSAGGGQVKIDISHLPRGVYFVRIGNRVEKFIKM